MSDKNTGKWLPYNLDGTLHTCRGKKVENKGPAPPTITLSPESLNARVQRIEKILDAFILAGVLSDGSP